ncbi:chromosome segregation protein SMC [Paeniglutamicibacter cryotolerans]|uniref:Chromosome partition protein Smc n=1 Tax=Paeniglutamicibacter cryotolerans TaxID=670079 RepID=A0A839QRJ5_9MICC|nr:chromosome segregation protein SMC [Paeniglutamicibacter cryotolerans]MBB2997404.1 chromosome segregation protein [Paeniglutamicibacter cryotolerans]
MHLKSLTVRGFKSFASATTFDFEPGVTAVVGPNGSGKSNVVDALAWVMGEQGAKTLRGGKMEDVIFAGTSGRPPLGRAHVSLTIDNADGALPIDYSEVTISRTLFRAGGSEYAINGSSCRLLDIQELLSDSGLGREMHVIVGQGQLDRILHATAEDRRGFIEEAAGILKHRRRKEKTVRKLDAMQGNLNRLNDLSAELRRQLTPLGKQAKVARRAQSVQFEARDARARLLADDLVALSTSLERDVETEAAQKARHMVVQRDLNVVRTEVGTLEASAAQATPAVNAARDTWYGLGSMRERYRSLGALATERSRLLGTTGTEFDAGRNPERLEAQAERLRSELEELDEHIESRRDLLEEALEDRAVAESAARAEQERMTSHLRAQADRREAMARLAGQVSSGRTRVESAAGELGRIRESLDGWAARRTAASTEFTLLEQDAAGAHDGEGDLDGAYEEAHAKETVLRGQLDALKAEEQELAARRGALKARHEALRLGLARKDASEDVLATGAEGIGARLSARLVVNPGYETAIAAALGSAAEALSAAEPGLAAGILEDLKAAAGGRVHFIIHDVPGHPGNGVPPASSVPALDQVQVPDALAGAVSHLLADVAIVKDAGQALALLSADPRWRAVTLDGDTYSAAAVAGGTAAAPSLIEQQAVVDSTEAELDEVRQRRELIRFDLAALTVKLESAAELAEQALERLHDSDARISAVAERMAQLGASLRQGSEERERLERNAAVASGKLEAEQEALAVLVERLELAQEEPEGEELEDAAIDRNRELADAAAGARQRELDARLGLRGAEERANGLRSRIESLLRTAEVERRAREQARRKAEQRGIQASKARRVAGAVEAALGFLDGSIALADAERAGLQDARTALDEKLAVVRRSSDALTRELAELTDMVHRDELVRAQQLLRIEALENRSIEELGLSADHLIDNYGPHLPVPQHDETAGKWAELRAEVDADGLVVPGGAPFDRAEQEKRLKRAERDLAALGKVNPLALEEFAALEERHKFLSTQLEDLKSSRRDLLDIIKDVDERVERVFTEAYNDTAAQFERVFSRLFPGGEGRLVLTDPDNMLTTGIEIEARPAGKKIKRLSLLSGGERSLTAVALLVAIFKARPSPFYVMDEVEAALDDTNLGRLITIFEELRESSQLIVITHQKRTMEVADALYGVTMRGDGVSMVISQRVRHPTKKISQ